MSNINLEDKYRVLRKAAIAQAAISDFMIELQDGRNQAILKALYDNNTATQNLAALIRIQLGGKDGK